MKPNEDAGSGDRCGWMREGGDRQCRLEAGHGGLHDWEEMSEGALSDEEDATGEEEWLYEVSDMHKDAGCEVQDQPEDAGSEGIAKLNIPPTILKHITRRQWARLWGQKSMIQPVFIEAHLGDGGRLIAITPLNTRPNYYLIRVDSKWWMDADRSRDQLHPENHIAEHIDDICEAIEEVVGRRDVEDDEGNDILMEWPALNEHSGVSWCDAMDLIEEGAKR